MHTRYVYTCYSQYSSEKYRSKNMKNKEKPEILIPKGYSVDELLDVASSGSDKA